MKAKKNRKRFVYEFLRLFLSSNLRLSFARVYEVILEIVAKFKLVNFSAEIRKNTSFRSLRRWTSENIKKLKAYARRTHWSYACMLVRDRASFLACRNMFSALLWTERRKLSKRDKRTKNNNNLENPHLGLYWWSIILFLLRSKLFHTRTIVGLEEKRKK